MVNTWSPASIPASRDNKPGWYKLHAKQAKDTYCTSSDTLLVGDSIVSGLSRYKSIWSRYFKNVENNGIPGDMTQHVLWRLRNTRLSNHIKFVVIHCGTNNIDLNQPDDIASALIAMVDKIHLYKPEVKVILSGILPRDSDIASIRREKILKTNTKLMNKCKNLRNVIFLEHDPDWTHDNGSLNNDYYFEDKLHLVKLGNEKLAKEISRTILKIKEDGIADNNTPIIPPCSYSPFSLSTNQTPQTPHIGKSDNVMKPKYEECEYSLFQPLTYSPPIHPTSPPSRRHSLHRKHNPPTQSPPPPLSTSTPPLSTSPPPLLQSSFLLSAFHLLIFIKISSMVLFNFIFNFLRCIYF